MGLESHAGVAAAIRGDAEAVRAVWQENRRWVAAVLLAHKPRQTELEDLLQDVAMTFVRTISRLRDEAMLRPWLRTVAINAARAAGRNTRRQQAKLGWQVTGESNHEEVAGPASPSDEPASAAQQHDSRQRRRCDRHQRAAAQLGYSPCATVRRYGFRASAQRHVNSSRTPARMVPGMRLPFKPRKTGQVTIAAASASRQIGRKRLPNQAEQQPISV